MVIDKCQLRIVDHDLTSLTARSCVRVELDIVLKMILLLSEGEKSIVCVSEFNDVHDSKDPVRVFHIISIAIMHSEGFIIHCLYLAIWARDGFCSGTANSLNDCK